MKILLIGHQGQVGTELQRTLAPLGKLRVAGRESVDLRDAASLRAFLRLQPFDIVVNAAAYTDVERAEVEPEIASAINGVAPRILAEEASRIGAAIIHYSTDYVFDGTRSGAYVETDPTCPINSYGKSKLEGEKAIAAIGGRWLVFRTSWVYGPHGRNFLLTMLNLAKSRPELRIVSDQIGSPTSSRMIAEATASVISRLSGVGTLKSSTEEFPSGVYHLTTGKATSWCGFAEKIFTLASQQFGIVAPKVIAIPTSEYACKAQRPLNSVLNNDMLERVFGIRLPDWQTALEFVMQELRIEAPARSA